MSGTAKVQAGEKAGEAAGNRTGTEEREGAVRKAAVRIKLCGLSRPCDIEAANELEPEYIGFVFAPKSRRYVTPQRAAELKSCLKPGILAVGVFTDETPEMVAELLQRGIIELAQLHGNEDESYIQRLRKLTDRPVIKAFRMESEQDAARAAESTADFVLLDSGNGGTGVSFDWQLIRKMDRPYFLAGGLDAGNVQTALESLSPYGVDVSSGIETGGLKDRKKMRDFVRRVRAVRPG